eukprot:5609975-Prymnesium_polylepis.1
MAVSAAAQPAPCATRCRSANAAHAPSRNLLCPRAAALHENAAASVEFDRQLAQDGAQGGPELRAPPPEQGAARGLRSVRRGHSDAAA